MMNQNQQATNLPIDRKMLLVALQKNKKQIENRTEK